jgi:phosphoribosylaminoimidazolecarboxamide formyltransferase/IMP cyclohydrolase
MLRPVRGGALGQPVADYVLDLSACAGNGQFDETAATDILIAWSAAYSSNHGGNEVALAKGGMLLAAGGGPSTVDAARSAATHCAEQGHDATGAAFAADAFFPFTDAPQILADAGAIRGAVPDGSRNDDTVKAFFHDRRIAVAWIPAAFRGFCRH